MLMDIETLLLRLILRKIIYIYTVFMMLYLCNLVSLVGDIMWVQNALLIVCHLFGFHEQPGCP